MVRVGYIELYLMGMRLVWLVFNCILCVSSVQSAVLVTAEGRNAADIVSALEFYQGIHKGSLPSTWGEFVEYYDINRVNNELIYEMGVDYPIQEHYQFLAGNVVFATHGGGLLDGSRILLVRSVPLAKNSIQGILGGLWRYVIYKDKNGRIDCARVKEEDIQTALKSAGVVLVENPRFPKVEVEGKLSRSDFYKKHPELDPVSKMSSNHEPGADREALKLPAIAPQIDVAAMPPGNRVSGLGRGGVLGLGIVVAMVIVWVFAKYRK